MGQTKGKAAGRGVGLAEGGTKDKLEGVQGMRTKGTLEVGQEPSGLSLCSERPLCDPHCSGMGMG